MVDSLLPWSWTGELQKQMLSLTFIYPISCTSSLLLCSPRPNILLLLFQLELETPRHCTSRGAVVQHKDDFVQGLVLINKPIQRIPC